MSWIFFWRHCVFVGVFNVCLFQIHIMMIIYIAFTFSIIELMLKKKITVGIFRCVSVEFSLFFFWKWILEFLFFGNSPPIVFFCTFTYVRPTKKIWFDLRCYKSSLILIFICFFNFFLYIYGPHKTPKHHHLDQMKPARLKIKVNGFSV